MRARKLYRFPPIRQHNLFPLPGDNLLVVGRPAIGDPVGMRRSWRVAGAAGKVDDHGNLHLLRQEDGLSEILVESFCHRGVRMKWISRTVERPHPDIAIFKLLFPRFAFGRIGQDVFHRNVFGQAISTRGYFHGFNALGGELIEHFVESEVVVDGIDEADGNFARRRRCPARIGRRGFTSATRCGAACNRRGRNQARGIDDELPAVDVSCIVISGHELDSSMMNQTR